MTFLEFKRTKSNEFFFDCTRPVIRGLICYYGMVSALLVQLRYNKLEGQWKRRWRVDEDDPLRLKDQHRGIREPANMLRLLVMNKNNCLDFLDSSGWPIDLLSLQEETRVVNLQETDKVLAFMSERRANRSN